MAAKKPIVLNSAGGFEQLQSGDTLDAPVSEKDVIQATNSNASNATIGQPVYVDGSGTVDLARANASGTTPVIGLVADASIAPAAAGNVQTDGVLVSADWTAVIGSAALTAGAEYFLSAAAAGQLTATAPNTTGQYVVPVGRALSATELEITIGRPIKL